jgi:hypothetical protein
MRRLRFFTLFILILVTSFNVANAQAEREFRIPILMDGDVIIDSLEDTTTAHLYGFNASAEDVVTITMTQESTLDPYLVLLGPRGELIAADDDSGDIAGSAAIRGVTLPDDGSYSVIATSRAFIDSGSSLNETQNYQLTISGITQPTSLRGYNPDELNYFAGKLNIGDAGIAETTSAEPVYYFTFDAAAGDVVNVGLSSETFEPLIQLFAPDGSRLAADSGNTTLGNIQLPEDGKYLILATDSSYYEALEQDWAGYGEFTISVK